MLNFEISVELWGCCTLYNSFISNWRIIALLHWAGIYQTSTWISRRFWPMSPPTWTPASALTKQHLATHTVLLSREKQIQILRDPFANYSGIQWDLTCPRKHCLKGSFTFCTDWVGESHFKEKSIHLCDQGSISSVPSMIQPTD